MTPMVSLIFLYNLFFLGACMTDMIRIVETVALFFLFIGLFYLLFIKLNKHAMSDSANLPFIGDDTSNEIIHSHSSSDLEKDSSLKKISNQSRSDQNKP
jgi:cbb3-type cytochrome oxidase subunit 3